MIELFNTLTRTKETLVPLNDNNITLYSCGPTVYDYPHIGNWYAFIRWDILVRVLVANGYSVNWVMNITDVGHLVSDADEGEDKLEKGAKREGKTAWDIAEYYSNYFIEALGKLNFMPITTMPKATKHIPQQIKLIQDLELKGFTYIIDDGVYFDTAKLNDYGKLAQLNIENLKAGARVEYNSQKKNPTDFALWKFSPKNEKRDMEWQSPWGIGFPGWHIECSAMSMYYLGETLDIHTGGIDHIPVHHTNEIAQSEAATNKQFANVWLHSNFIKVDGKKMSKSLGNFLTLEDLVAKGINTNVFRLLVLESHYRSEAQFTFDIAEATKSRLQRWINTANLRWQPQEHTSNTIDFDVAYTEALNMMNNDLDSPKLLETIDVTLREVESNGIAGDDTATLTAYLERVQLLTGLELLQPDAPQDIKDLLQRRKQARDTQDWVLTDKLRKEAHTLGYSVKDTSNGQLWERLI